MIRYYEKEDIKEISKIIVDDWKETYKGMVDEEYLRDLTYKKKEEKIMNNYEKQKAIVYVEDNNVLGYCRFGESREKIKDYGEIIALYVRKDCKRKRNRKSVNK